MSDNGMGGRHIGKKYHITGNIEETSDFMTFSSGRLSEWEQLIADYHRDKKYIKSLKRKWIEPKPRTGLPPRERKTKP